MQILIQNLFHLIEQLLRQPLLSIDQHRLIPSVNVFEHQMVKDLLHQLTGLIVHLFFGEGDLSVLVGEGVGKELGDGALDELKVVLQF